MLKSSQLKCNLDELYKGLGQNDRFDNMVLKMVVEIFSACLHLLPENKADVLLAEEAVYEDEGLPRETVSEEAPLVDEVIFENDLLTEDVVYKDEASEDEVQAGEGYEEAAPAEEMYEETAPTGEVYEEADHAGEVVHEYDAHAEIPPPDEVSAEAAQASVIKASQADLALYSDWDSLTPLKQKKRVKKLKAKGLPIPNEDGSISVFKD